MSNRVIVISREYASAGSEIGRRLAAELGIPFYDRRFVDEQVKNSGLSSEFVQQEERKFISSLLFNLSTGGYHYANDRSVSDQIHVAETTAIKQVAAQSSCVIVGRCADYILRDEADVLSVFVYADMAARVKRCVEEYGKEERRIEQFIRDKDRTRARHYEYYTGRTWGERKNYHLCLNSGALGVDQSVQLLLKTFALTDRTATAATAGE